jgi:hypothetical protein
LWQSATKMDTEFNFKMLVEFMAHFIMNLFARRGRSVSRSFRIVGYRKAETHGRDARATKKKAPELIRGNLGGHWLQTTALQQEQRDQSGCAQHHRGRFRHFRGYIQIVEVVVVGGV